jgi:hypothetical protein
MKKRKLIKAKSIKQASKIGSQKAKLPPVIELAYELEKIEAEIEGLKHYTETESARQLVPLIRRTGAYKGEIVDLTPVQYKKLMGHAPKKAIINKRGKIPWELAFDELATELGYKSDEQLKKTIEDIGHKLHRIDQLERSKARIVSDIKRSQARTKLELLTTKIELNGQVKAKEIYLGTRKLGTVVRIPSEWRIVWTENGIEPGAIESPLATTRYAKNIKKEVKEAFALDQLSKEKRKKPKRKVREKGRKKS